ncbi:MAG: hypothetical protein U0441_19785 [Polyangiaceae bacterium]
MSITLIPHDVVATVCSVWKEVEYIPPYPCEGFATSDQLSPTLEEWDYLLNLAFGASLRTDEARPTTFQIGFRRDVDSLLEDQILSSWDGFSFATPLSANVAELTKLAHAATGTSSLVWLRRLRGNGAYLITGIGPGWRAEATEDPDIFVDGPPAPLPLIQVTGPAQLRISKGNSPVAWISADRFTTVRGEDVLGRFVAARCEEFIKRVTAFVLGSASLESSRREELERYVRFRTTRSVEHIVKSIVARHHGGLLLMVPTPQKSQWEQLLRTKYQTHPISHRGLARSIEALTKLDSGLRFSELFNAIYNVEDKQFKDFIRRTDAMSLARYLHQYRSIAANIGALSGVDGATVLTSDFCLWAFGAEVRCHEADIDVCYPVRAVSPHLTLDESVPFTKYGTRHRAAFRFCREVPDALAVVVSQDGATKLVTSHEGKVVFIDNIERDLP